MRLIGAKEFLKTVKHGTLFVQFWGNKETCHTIIEEFNNGVDIVKKYEKNFNIFGDNSHSLSFLVDDDTTAIIDGITYNCLFNWDLNIVGDASPTETLYLVFDNEEEWPNEFKVEWYDEYEEFEPLTKEDVKRIQKWYMENDCFVDHSSVTEWPLRTLYTEKIFNDDEIVNYGLTRSGDLWKQILNK